MSKFPGYALGAIAVAALSQTAMAEHDRYAYASGPGYRDASHQAVQYAEVLEVEPIFRTVTVRSPERECWQEEVHTQVNYYDDRARRHRSTAGPTIAGGIIGGVIGRQFGDGKGRDAMTVVGTLVGSAIANSNAARRNHRASNYARSYSEPSVEWVQRCETVNRVHQEERIDGYRVTYLYNDREYITRSEHDPGHRIPVRVSITPLGEY